MLPSPRPPSNLSTPKPPRMPLTKPPRPSPLSNLPTRPKTPDNSSPTAAIIWNRGSVSNPHNGFNFFFACGMSEILFFVELLARGAVGFLDFICNLVADRLHLVDGLVDDVADFLCDFTLFFLLELLWCCFFFLFLRDVLDQRAFSELVAVLVDNVAIVIDLLADTCQ